jgi:hypothetical protein
MKKIFLLLSMVVIVLVAVSCGSESSLLPLVSQRVPH